MSTTGSIPTLLVPAFYFLIIIMMMQIIIPPDIVESFIIVGSTPRWSCNPALIASHPNKNQQQHQQQQHQRILHHRTNNNNNNNNNNKVAASKHSNTILQAKGITSTNRNEEDEEENNVVNNDEATTEEEEDETTQEIIRICVIGAGWAGFTAADALSTAMCHTDKNIVIDVLDASPRGAGGLAGGWRTPKLQLPVETGLHGFWREYKNTFDVIQTRIGIDQLDDVLTDFTPSILISEYGKVATAPVLGTSVTASTNHNKNMKKDPSTMLLSSVADVVPPPLDVALLSDFQADPENPNSRPLTITDRVSAIGLLGPWADFRQDEAASWERYDQISADNLFTCVAGVSTNLYQQLVLPLLHVLPMTTGYDCSAAAALSCFHVFALQSKGAFDVRWCRGTISDKLFNPWAEKLVSAGINTGNNNNEVNIRGNSKVTSIATVSVGAAATSSHKQKESYNVEINGKESVRYDAVILAVGGTAMKNLIQCSPILANHPDSSKWKKFRGVTCCAVRIFFDKQQAQQQQQQRQNSNSSLSYLQKIEHAMKESPVVVCGPNIGNNLPELIETGFCIYDLQRLHDEFSSSSSSSSNAGDNDTTNTTNNIIAYEIDFFRADDLIQITDDMEVAKIALSAVSAALNIDDISQTTFDLLVADVSVVR